MYKNKISKVCNFLILFLIISCNQFQRIAPYNPNVYSISFENGEIIPSLIMDASVNEILTRYRRNDISKNTNYEVYSQTYSFGLNWNPEQKILFAGFGSGLCDGWNTVFINVDEAKLNTFERDNIKLSTGKGTYFNLSIYLEEEKDKTKAAELKKKYFNTNSCKGKG